MKRTIALFLAAILVAAALVSLAYAPTANARIRTTSDDAADAAAWLEERLGDRLSDRVVMGTDSAGYGVDLSALEDDGYIIRSVGAEIALFARTTDGLDRAARAYAKSVEAGEGIADAAYHEGYRIKRIEIAGRDISEYTVFCENEPYLVAAANEFAARIKEACGVSLTVSTEASAAPSISIGYVHDDSLNTCGYRWTVDENGLALLCSDGYKPSSAHYGVVRFLENALGWFGLSFGYEALVEAELISLPVGESGGETNAFGQIAVYGDSHCPSDLFEHPYGSLNGIPTACHGLQSNKFGGALSTSPNRNWENDQPCWLSEEFLEESYEDILAYIEKILSTGCVIGEDFFFVDIAHGDNDNWCACRDCTKLYRDEGATHSAHIVTWANDLIAEINKVRPGLFYGIFA